MPRQFEKRDVAGGPFRLGDWLVEPSLNRLTRGDTTIQLELKVMDVLVCLAERAGEVVTRQEIIDRVWATEFISDNTLTHAITEIRNALGDDARNPSFIETIHRRGYRMIAPVEAERPTATISRFPSAVRPAAEDDRSPYPGLAAFTEEDAEFFFGREDEVAHMWRKLTSRRLLAVIGPSGVGKSSFLRAGVIPAKPEGWGVIVCQPGEAPMRALARALLPEFADDMDAGELLVGPHEADTMVALVARWREHYSQALLVVDQFEELFTQNPPDVQSGFAGFLRKLVDSSDVHVVLAMRDDFLHRCHDHEALATVFEALTPVKAPAADALRRALVEPARRLGFEFEDGDLPGMMVAEVEGERGALPMLAFAVARLWEKRDLERRLLTRQAYADIGGVGGALARHAEATLKAIGNERLPIVRELFRNLVTAEGTRAVREWNELLSIFGDSRSESLSESPEEVLRGLIDARLLTSYEFRDQDEGPTRRVEVVHESLLSSWPRLVGWQTQDADSARIRDELRQAARTWDDHDRPNDLLWTGSAYNEYRLWRSRYPGGLTALEEDFATAMTANAKWRTRRRRVAIAVVVLILAAVSVVTTTLWQHSTNHARRAEAHYLLSAALQDFEWSHDPGRALAHVIASLHLNDDWPARALAVQLAVPAPLPRIAGGASNLGVDFSPNGQWLAVSEPATGRLLLWPSRGGTPRSWQVIDRESQPDGPFLVKFTPDSSCVMTYWPSEPTVRFWSVPDGRPAGLFDKGPELVRSLAAIYSAMRMIRITGNAQSGWSLDRKGAERIQKLGDGVDVVADLSSDGRMLAYATEGRVVVEHLGRAASSESRSLGNLDHPVQVLRFDPRGHRFATEDTRGELRLWSVDGEILSPLQVWQGLPVAQELRFDPSGLMLAVIGTSRVEVIDLTEPPDSEPLSLRIPSPAVAAFHPQGHWLAVAGSKGTYVWPLDRKRLVTTLRGHSTTPAYCAFDTEGRWLVSSSADRTVRAWPLARSTDRKSRIVFSAPGSAEVCPRISVNAKVVAIAWGAERVRLVPLDGGEPTEFDWPGQILDLVAIDVEGRRVAAGGKGSTTVRVWDLESGDVVTLEGAYGLHIERFRFLPNGDLLVRHAPGSASYPGLSVWRFSDGRREGFFEGASIVWSGDPDSPVELSRDGRYTLCLGAENGARVWSEAPVYLADLEARSLRRLDGFTGLMTSLDRSGAVVATWDPGPRIGSFIQVGPAGAKAPYLVPHPAQAEVFGFPSISPTADRIAMGYGDGSIRLYPVPDFNEPPLHTLPREELIAKLKTLTNLRAVRDEESSTGWKVEVGPFPGWETVPEW